MKLKTALFLLVLLPSISYGRMMIYRGSHATPLNPEDCGNRTNSMGSQVNGLQGLVHKVALVGEESGREVSNDPNTEEARNAEASGYGLICGIDVGTLNLVEHNGKKVLVGAAHGFYQKGRNCNEETGEFFPDDHYSKNSNIDHQKGFKFKLPPLNHNTALKTKSDILSEDRLNDLVILEVEDESLFRRQSGGTRTTIKMSGIPIDKTEELANHKSLTLTGGRKNFFNYGKVSTESGCRVYPAPNSIPVLRHTCDTGSGSSGNSLNYEHNNQLYSVGIHYGTLRDKGQPISPNLPLSNVRGNYIIPAESVIKALDNVIPKPVQPNTLTEDTVSRPSVSI